MARSVLVGVALIAALVLSPFSACDRFTYHFGASELRAAIEGTWQITPRGQPRITVTIMQGGAPDHAALGWIRKAAACGDRSLIRTAGACMDTTSMPLAIAIVDGLPRDTETHGTVLVAGSELVSANLELHLGALVVEAKVSPTGEAESWTDATIVRLRRP